MQMKVYLAAMFLAVAMSTTAQEIKGRPTSYNYTRGIEAYQKGNADEALEYLNKDVQENPKSGYSYSWIACVRISKEEYGQALNACEMAIKLLPKKDKEYMAFAYTTRSDVYLNLEDTVKALEDITTAIKLIPEDDEVYEKRAQIYYEQEKYDLSDADYQKIIALKPGNTMGYMGIGRNANAQEKWDDAIKQFDYVTKLASDYSSGYSFRADAYIGKEDWDHATDDIITALSLGWDRKTLYQANALKEPAFTMLVSKINIQSAKSPNEATWPYIIGNMYESSKNYAKAVEYYEKANSKDVSPSIYKRIASCQEESGRFEEAMSNIDQAISLDSTDNSYHSLKAGIYYGLGNIKSAIAEWDKVLTQQPDDDFAYYRRGWYKELNGDLDGALEDFSTSIVLDPNYSYAHVCRGEIYLKQGKKELAEADFKKVIELEDTPDKYSCIFYAYQGLGQNNEAIATIDTFIARDTTNASNYYEAACLYSRMQDKSNGLKYLEKSLEHGYNRYFHIMQDNDLKFLRDDDEFKVLMEKYKPASSKEDVGQNVEAPNEKQTITEIPFTKEGGICKVKCETNGLPLHFVFDTGASTVTISSVEATFMMKNGFLSKNDVIGSQYYMDANATVSVGTVINIKNVSFGGLNLSNIRATVVENQKAPLLLGQSVLARLGKIEIDNTKKVLRVTHH